MERRLGRGLGSLLGDSEAVEPNKAAVDLPIDQIRPNPHQPRRHFEESALQELASSLRRHGLLQPIVVRAARGAHELISGERRWRAARIAGLERLPAIVKTDVTDDQMLELALVENVQREDLNAIERAQAFQAMIAQLGLTQEEVARKVGLQRATVANQLRLLELPAEVQAAIAQSLISMGHARALVSLGSARQQIEALARIVREGLSVRQVEALTQARAASGAAEGGGTTIVPRKAWITELEGRLRERLGTKVAIRNGRGYRGQIVIDYFDRAALERVADAIAPRDRLE